MACDVTIALCLLQIFFISSDSVLGTDQLITKPGYLTDNLYFEVIHPDEVSYTYKIRPAKDFGAQLNTTFFDVRLVPAVPFHGCSPMTNAAYLKDAIAFVERGGCSFVTKTIHAEQAGALAAIITDHDTENDNRMIDMIQDETGRATNIASFFLLGKDGYMIRNTLQTLHLDSAKINIPINVTSTHSMSLNQPPWTLW